MVTSILNFKELDSFYDIGDSLYSMTADGIEISLTGIPSQILDYKKIGDTFVYLTNKIPLKNFNEARQPDYKTQFSEIGIDGGVISLSGMGILAMSAEGDFEPSYMQFKENLLLLVNSSNFYADIYLEPEDGIQFRFEFLNDDFVMISYMESLYMTVEGSSILFVPKKSNDILKSQQFKYLLSEGVLNLFYYVSSFSTLSYEGSMLTYDNEYLLYGSALGVVGYVPVAWDSGLRLSLLAPSNFEVHMEDSSEMERYESFGNPKYRTERNSKKIESVKSDNLNHLIFHNPMDNGKCNILTLNGGKIPDWELEEGSESFYFSLPDKTIEKSIALGVRNRFLKRKFPHSSD